MNILPKTFKLSLSYIVLPDAEFWGFQHLKCTYWVFVLHFFFTTLVCTSFCEQKSKASCWSRSFVWELLSHKTVFKKTFWLSRKAVRTPLPSKRDTLDKWLLTLVNQINIFHLPKPKCVALHQKLRTLSLDTKTFFILWNPESLRNCSW